MGFQESPHPIWLLYHRWSSRGHPIAFLRGEIADEADAALTDSLDFGTYHLKGAPGGEDGLGYKGPGMRPWVVDQA